MRLVYNYFCSLVLQLFDVYFEKSLMQLNITKTKAMEGTCQRSRVYVALH